MTSATVHRMLSLSASSANIRADLDCSTEPYSTVNKSWIVAAVRWTAPKNFLAIILANEAPEKANESNQLMGDQSHLLDGPH